MKHHVCECRRRTCRSKFAISHAQYVRFAKRGQKIVAAGHIEATDFVAKTVCDGAAVVVGHPRVLASVIVACPECGEKRETSARNARRIESGEQSGKCGWCRHPNRVKPAHLQPLLAPDLSSEYHKFWRERFTQTEIDALWSAVSLYLDVPEVIAA